MNPGDDGGIEPSRFLRWRRRYSIQHAKMPAAAARPSGTPRPIPIFSDLESPSSVLSAASGANPGLVEDDGSDFDDPVSDTVGFED